MKIEYHPAVEHELRQIIDFYNERAPGLGNQFLNEFEKQALIISSVPNRWMIIDGDIRRTLMKRFPYVIYFQTIGAEIVRVTVVKHQRRHPKYGIHRR